MTLAEFCDKYDDQYIDVDGMYNSQCKDLFSAYNTEVVGCPFYIYGNANELWDNAPKEYYSQESSPQKGDVVIWGTGIGAYGHVAIFVEDKGNTFNSFDQNFPIGSPCHFQNHTYSNITGYLRPKGATTMNYSMLDVVRNVVNSTYRAYLHTPTEAEIALHANAIMANGNTYNLQSLADWVTMISKSPEFTGKWMLKKDCKVCPPPVVCPPCPACPPPTECPPEKECPECPPCPECPKPECPDIDIMTPWELVKLGINKWLSGSKVK